MRTCKIIGAVVVLLALICLLAWAWETVGQHKAGAEKSLLAAAQARQRAKSLEAELTKLEVELDEVTSRPPEVVEKVRERVVVKYRDAPPLVVDYLASHKREIRWSNEDGSVKVHVPDAISGDTVDVDIDTDILCKPYIEECLKPVDTGRLKSPIRRGPLLDMKAGYGYAGIEGDIGTWPIEMGSSRFKVQAGAWGRMTMQDTGAFTGNAAVGLRVQFK